MAGREMRAYGGHERRGGRGGWQPRDREAERMFAVPRRRRRLRLWVEVVLWIALALLMMWLAVRVGDKLDAMGDQAWVSPAAREVAAEVESWR